MSETMGSFPPVSTIRPAVLARIGFFVPAILVAVSALLSGCQKSDEVMAEATASAAATETSDAMASGKSLHNDMVDRAIAMHGGEIYRNSEIALTMSSKSGDFRIEVKNNDGVYDYRVTDLRADSGTVYRHSNLGENYSDILERYENGEAVELDEEGRAAVSNAVAARVWFAFLPLRLNDGNTYKEDQGLETWNGRQLHRVKVTFEAGTSNRSQDAYAFWFDPETARLEQFAYSFDGGLRFRPLENYRQVGGVMFYDQPNFAIDGPGLSVDLITPEYVENEMELLSTVYLKDIEVR
jgi:hypothetical protein